VEGEELTMDSRSDYTNARQSMIDSWSGTSTPDTFRRFIADLIARGWTRRDMYDLTNDLLDHEAERSGENAMEELLEFETSLTGWCAASSILRFPCETEDEAALVAWVRGNEWRNR
jgi:hypothetical protein